MEFPVHKYPRRILAGMIAASMLFSMAACSGGQQAVETIAEETVLVPVETQKPQVGNLSRSTEFMGTVEPDDLVDILPKMSGTVLRVHAKVGDYVKKGDLLYEFDPVDVQVQLAAQQAAVNVAQAAVVSAQAQVDQSLGSSFDLQIASLESQLLNAKNSYSLARQSLRDYNDGSDDAVDKMISQRDTLRNTLPALESRAEDAKEAYLRAVKEGVDDSQLQKLKVDWELAEDKVSDAKSNISMLSANINDKDDEDATARSLRSQVKNAQLAYDSSNTIYELTKSEVRNDALKVANASLGQATASFEAQVKSYEAAAHQLEYTKVYSPIDGVIESCTVAENGNSSPSAVAFTVSSKANIMATFYVPADAAATMAPGDIVDVVNGQQTFKGELTEVGTMVDPSTGLFKVKASVSGADGVLMTGLSVKITAETAKTSGGILIPQSALSYEDGRGYVYVSKDGKAVKTYVETGVANNEVIEITSGLSTNDDLIVTWNPNLRDGVEIEARPVSDAPSEPADAASSEAASDTENDSAPGSSGEGEAGAGDASSSAPEASSSETPVGDASSSASEDASSAASGEGNA